MISCAHPLDEGDLATRAGAAAPLPFIYRRLGPGDLTAVAEFRTAIFANLPDPDMYVPEDPGFLEAHLDGSRGLVFGLYVEDRLAACAILGLPGPDMPNFGADLKLPPGDLGRVAHIASSMVDPAFRGWGLQKRLFNYRLQMAAGAGRTLLLARVANSNPVSWRNMLKCGMQAVAQLRMHGTRLRLLFARDLAKPVPQFGPIHRQVAAIDGDGHSAALAQGLRGIRQERTASGIYLAYAPPVAADG